MKGQRFSTKAAIISLIALGLLVSLGVAVWIYPPLLLYGMLVATGIVAYVAVYFIVVSSMRRDRPKRSARVTVEGELVKHDLT